MTKPNTMDDWIDELFYNNLPTYAIDEKYLKRAKALITAKLEEVDRAARAEGLDMGLTIAEKILTATPEELRKSITEGKKYLASLKGGDV